MRIVLLDLKDPRDQVVDKTIAGGMGTASRYGKGLFSRALTRLKAASIRLLPYNVAYVAAILRAQGHEVQYRTSLQSLNTLQDTVDVAVVFTAIPSATEDQRALTLLAERAIPSIVVGTLAGVAPQNYSAATLIIKGEPEAFFFDVRWPERLAGVKGDAASSRAFNPEFPNLLEVGTAPDLNVLPMPDWSIFPSLSSRYAILTPYQRVLPVVTSRGCPYPCGYYCPYPLGEGKAMRFRAPEAVADELVALEQRYGVTAVKFRDPIFTVNRPRTVRLLDVLEQRKLKTIWGCETHLDRLDEELLERMARAGCRLIQTGIESINPEVIKASHRKTAEVLHQEKMLVRCRELGIKTAIYFIVGLPEDTMPSMRASLEYAQTLPATFIQITACTPYPGTRFFADVEDRLLTQDWRELDQYTPVLRSENFSSEELVGLMGEGYRRFYVRETWLRNGLPQALARC